MALHTIDNGPVRKFDDFATWNEVRRSAYPHAVHLSRTTYTMIVNRHGDKEFVLLAQWVADFGKNPSSGVVAVQPKHIAEEMLLA